MWNTFDKFNSVHKKYKYNLPESEILDLEEKICESESFEKWVTQWYGSVNARFVTVLI